MFQMATIRRGYCKKDEDIRSRANAWVSNGYDPSRILQDQNLTNLSIAWSRFQMATIRRGYCKKRWGNALTDSKTVSNGYDPSRILQDLN